VVEPEKKSTVYQEVSCIFWDEKEWKLYFTLWGNIKMQTMPVLREHHISFEKYQKWISQLTDITFIKPLFYPFGVDSYFMIDFLFESVYHRQLASIFGMLPSTSVFFSVGNNFFARLCVLNKKEYNELLSFIHVLGKTGYFTAVYQANVISSTLCGDNHEVSD